MQNDFFIAQIDQLHTCIADAGEAIMHIYENEDFEIEYKKDASPLTKADKAAHLILQKGLSLLTPDIPVLSEESKLVPYETRRKWPLYWCVDPLDGTKEFINRNGEFAINVALIKNNQPVAGIIYAPVTKIFYYGMDGFGSWKKNPFGTSVLLENKEIPKTITAVGSRSHAHAEEQRILEIYEVNNFISIGSALKFCMIAEGMAQIYCRVGPTMEWDTAAGHAILNNANCELTLLNGNTFQYNKPELVNPGFICKTKGIKKLPHQQ